MAGFVLFLHGRYLRRDLPYYRSLCRSRRLIAVDGGYKFFAVANLTPHVLLGDFDSLRSIPRDLPKTVEVIRYETAKDKTDAELALDYCVGKRASRIDIVQPQIGEPDQFLGNIMLLSGRIPGKAGKAPQIRLLNVGYEILPLWDQRIVIRGGVRDRVSIVPISDQVCLQCGGTEFPADHTTVRRGETLPLRNRIASKVAWFSVQGRALLIRQYSRRR